MAETVLVEFKQEIDEFTLIPSSGGAFEVSVDGEQLYSKLDTGEYPEEQAIVEAIRPHVD